MANYHTFKRQHRRPKSAERLLLERLVRDMERLKRKVDTIMPVIEDLEAVTTRIEGVAMELEQLAQEPNPSDARVQGVTNRLTVVADTAQVIIDNLRTPVAETPVETLPV